jgi:ribose-phosphate pyrophosphokinase
MELSDQLLASGIRSIRSTSSVPHPTNAIVLDSLLAEALRAEINGSLERPSWV